MAWFALHCPSIIQAGEEPPEGVRMALLRRFEGFRGHGLTWLRSANCCAVMTSTAFFGAFPIFVMQAMVKNSRM